MKYLIVQNWNSTKGNHAGMVHMCNLLCANWPEQYKMLKIEEPRYRGGRNSFIKKINKLINFFIKKFIFPAFILRQGKTFLGQLKKGDEVFLLEYLIPEVNQYVVAKFITRHYKDIYIYALSHMTPTFMHQNNVTDELIRKWASPVDKMLTLGHSLSDYFIKIGIPSTKISTGFHYVDNQYYTKSSKSVMQLSKPFTIIIMGAMMRNDELVANIVQEMNDVNWIVCFGRRKIPESFPRGKNIKLLGYLPEDDLKSYMEDADASLSIMKDTIGSNVITTSFAMGLINIVSDVGSIRDYCSSDDSVLCENNLESFIRAINELKQNPSLVESMKLKSLAKSTQYSIINVHKWFSSLKNDDRYYYSNTCL